MKVILAMCIGLASFAYAAENDWVKVATTSNLEFSLKKNTGEFSKNDGGERIYLGVGRVLNKVTTESKAEIWYVTLGTCAKQMGYLVSTNTDGKVTNKSEFTFGQGSVASEIGEVLCYLAIKTVENPQMSPEKGIKKNA